MSLPEYLKALYKGGNIYSLDKYKMRIETWKEPKWDWYKIFAEEHTELGKMLKEMGVRDDVIEKRYGKLWEDFKEKAKNHSGSKIFVYESPIELRTITEADRMYLNPLRSK